MDDWLEDHGGFFCARCGRERCGEADMPCTGPTTSSDVDWPIVLKTLEDSLPAPWEHFHYNEPTRKRALAGLEAFLRDRRRLERIRGGRRC